MQVQKAVEEGVRILPPIAQDPPDPHELLNTDSNMNDYLMRRSSSTTGITEPVLKFAEVCDPESLVKKFLSDFPKAPSSKVARKKTYF